MNAKDMLTKDKNQEPMQEKNEREKERMNVKTGLWLLIDSRFQAHENYFYILLESLDIFS